MKNCVILFSIVIFLILILKGSQFLNDTAIRPYHFTSTNSEFSYNLYPAKGGDMKTLNYHFNEWEENYSTDKNQSLYRTFPKNYLKFWKWNEYKQFVYQYPYKKWKAPNEKE